MIGYSLVGQYPSLALSQIDGLISKYSSSDGSIKLWDLAALGSSSTAISTLRDHAGDVWALSWLPDPLQPDAIDGLGGTGAGIGGGKLVSAGEDAGVRWWRGTGV